MTVTDPNDPVLHEGNVLRRLLSILKDSDDLVEVDMAHAQALQHVKSLEATIVRQNLQLKEHRAPEAHSRDGREVMRLRHVTGNLLMVAEVPEPLRDEVVARLSHPVTSPIEIIDQILVDNVNGISDRDSLPKLLPEEMQPVSVVKHKTWERGYN